MLLVSVLDGMAGIEFPEHSSESHSFDSKLYPIFRIHGLYSEPSRLYYPPLRYIPRPCLLLLALLLSLDLGTEADLAFRP